MSNLSVVSEDNREIARHLSDPIWRINNLYWIVDEDGRSVQFKLRPVQKQLYWELWHRNIVLKSRQHGFTTLLALVALDRVLFNENYAAGIIAHKMSDAQKIFRNKIQYPYRHLPAFVKKLVPITKETTEEYVFSNNSSLSVSTSYRSGTLQWLHVSEYGKIAAKFPAKADEIDTGAFEAVHQGGIITIESTAEGNHGLFKDKVEDAKAMQDARKTLTRLNWRLHFVPWWKDPKNKVEPEEVEYVVIPERLDKYFDRLRGTHRINLTPRQKAWYTVKEATLGQRIWREHPSIPEEPFKVSLDGAYWAEQMQQARQDGRITLVVPEPHVLVKTWWDIGRDTTAIWFTQDIGNMINVIHYFQDSGQEIGYYAKKVLEIADERKLTFAPSGHHFPHDMEVTDYSNLERKTRLMIAAEAGLPGVATSRMKHKEDGIEAGRVFLHRCVFDEKHCEEGIAGLEAYRKEWDQERGVWKDIPLHDWASHPADAFQNLALNHIAGTEQQAFAPIARPIRQVSARGWT